MLNELHMTKNTDPNRGSSLLTDLGTGGILAEMMQKVSIEFEGDRPKTISKKSDNSQVSSIDVLVEENIFQLAEQVFPGVKVLSEERITDVPDDAKQFLQQGQILILDPIDGTNNFINGFPLYAVSLCWSSLSNNEVTFDEGAVLFPEQRKIVFTSGGKTFQTLLGSNQASLVNTSERLKAISGDDILFLNLSFYSHFNASTLRWSPDCPNPRSTCSTVIDMVYSALGIGVGTITAARIWDLAASIAIGKNLGVYLHRLSDGEIVKSLNFNDFHFGVGIPWQLKEPYIFCRPEHFDTLKKLIEYKVIDFGKLKSSSTSD